MLFLVSFSRSVESNQYRLAFIANVWVAHLHCVSLQGRDCVSYISCALFVSYALIQIWDILEAQNVFSYLKRELFPIYHSLVKCAHGYPGMSSLLPIREPCSKQDQVELPLVKEVSGHGEVMG